MDTGFIFDLDPTFYRIGPFQFRYYGLIFVAMLYSGYMFWRWQMLRAGHSLELTQRFVVWGFLAVVVGSRLGHCLFYDPAAYFSDPLTILYIWQGGLSSHGATIGLILALYFFARSNGLSKLDILDRFSFSAATGAALVRLGNFFNSEIVGRETELPWGVRFFRYDGGVIPRHPSQLYEFLMGVVILLVLLLADRMAGGEKRARGLLAGLFLTLYFFGRFMVEYVKEYQTLENSVLTMGQYLSIVPFLLGVFLLVWSRRGRGNVADNT